ncbi:fibronectin type III domain-containing protein [Owenweeksia hongkongensis]|uniref:fibronectin type III domain-containing protein n=1 Tax=Owenweeksia hongkongensis TaxID=253245 RepID=UPI003A94F985
MKRLLLSLTTLLNVFYASGIDAESAGPHVNNSTNAVSAKTVEEVEAPTSLEVSSSSAFYAGCGVVSTFPYSEGFEGVNWVSGSGSNNTGFMIDSCWTGSSSAGSTYSWGTSTGASSTGSYGPSYGFGGSGNYVYTEASGVSSGDMANLASPSFDLSSLNFPELNFRYHMYGSGMGDFMVWAWNGTSYDTIMSVTGDQGNSWLEASLDLSAYKTVTTHLVFHAVRNGFRSDMAIDNIMVSNGSPCIAPTNLQSSNVTASSATISWNYGGTAPSLTLYYVSKDSAIGTGTSVQVTSSPYVMSGLFGNSAHDVYITANCSGTNGISDTVGPVSFTTSCGGIGMATPFTETFNTTSTGSSSNPSEPTCWSYEETSGAKGYAYTDGGSAYAAGFARGGIGNSFRFYTSSTIADGDSMALVSPKIANMTTTPKQMELWIRSRSSGSSYDVKVVVGTVAGQNMLNTFIPLDTISIGNKTTYQNFTVWFNTANGYNGTHEYMAILDLADGNDSYQLDDITISDAPNCLPSTDLLISNITNSGADLSWTAGQGIHQEIVYGPVGFSQATATVHKATGTSHTISGLWDDDCFEVYVRDSCASGYSPWAGPYSFCTLCNYYNTPLVEGFETTPTGGNTNPSTPDCWSFVHTGAGDGYGFTHDSPGDSKTDSTYFYLHTNNNPASNDLMGLVSPGINGLTTGDKQIELWARSRHPYAIHDINLIVGTVVSPLDMSTFIPIDTFHIGNNTTYQHFSTEITTTNGYNGTHSYIAVLDNSTTGSYAFIDDITIGEIPTCTASSNLAAAGQGYDSAYVSWTAGQGLAYNLEFGPVGFTQGNGTLVKGITNPYAGINGLSGATCYDIYVRDSCASGLSPWFGPISFCTTCSPIATPITENFDTTASGSTSNPSPPVCWSYYENQNVSGYGNTSTTGIPNGAKHWRMYSPTSSATDTIALISPAIAGITNGDKMISFYSKTAGASFSKVVVGTSPSNTSLKNFTPIDTLTTDGASYSTKFEVYLDQVSGYNGKDEYIVIMHGNATTHTYVYVDDIIIDDIPPCTAPYNLGVSNITSSGATLSWSTSGGSGFRVEYGPVGFTQGTGTTANGTVVSNSTSPTTIGGLAPNTTYQFYVADNCDSSTFAGPFSFTTTCTGQLSGVYSVGSPTADFSDLDTAFSVLSNCGITGPVTLNLQGGNHSVFSMRLGHIDGASATNTVSIVGGTVSADTLNYGSGSNILLELDSTNYVTFKNINIYAPNASRMVWMHSQAEHITFDSINFFGGATTSSNHYLIVASSSPTSIISGNGDNVSNFTLKNSNLYGGYLSMIILSRNASNKSSNFTIENNNFIDPYYYGIRMYNVDNVNISSNKINCTGPSSYAILLQDADYLTIEGNETKAGNYGLYINGSNKTGAPSRSTIINNMFIGGNYGVYFQSTKHVNIYHNSIFGDNRGFHFQANFNNNFDMINNIVVSDMGEAIFASNDPVSAVFDYNLYYTNGSTPFQLNSTNYATLAAWQTAAPTENDSSLYGDPLFIAPDDLRIVLGTLANDKGDNTVGVLTDIDQNTRPASGSIRVDIGAYEYSPIVTDLSMVEGGFKRSLCLSQNDTVEIKVENITGSNINLATDSIMVSWDVSGPVASSGTVVANTGNLPLGDTLSLMALGVDLSVPGTYLLNAYIEPTMYNAYLLNDTLIQTSIVINPLWEVSPIGDTLYSTTDSSDLVVKSPFFGEEAFFITEICQYAGSGTGTPSGGAPSWLIADDYIEITGTPGADLEGITLEQWSLSNMEGTYTFPKGTILGPNGTAIIAVGDLGSSVPSPSDFYYHGNGTFGGTYSSGEASGRILKDANNNIIDAVGYHTGYTFPTAAGVSPNDWSGSAISGSSSWGIRLEGPDMNSPAGWVKSTQDPNAVNNMVTVPSVPSSIGFTWSKVVNGNLVQVDTVPEIKIGESTPGIFFYVASYTNACGTFTDTVTIYSFVTGCPGPTNITSSTSCTEATITWTSDVNTTDSYIEYGLAGFTYGSGTPVVSSVSPQVISGLSPNTAYDFYIIDSCTAAGFSTPVKVTDSTQIGFTSATFSWVQSATSISNATVDFDASNSVNGTTYTWDFGDGSAAGSGAMPTHQYTANGQFYVTVDAEGPCDTTSFGDTILVEQISISEIPNVGQSFDIYPNPTNGKVYVELNLSVVSDATLRVRNFMGQEVHQRELGTVSNDNIIELDLTEQAGGVYFIEVLSNGDSSVKRVVIQH